MINKQTTLELNGPNIAFIQQPQSVTIDRLGSAQFVGIATATFPVQDPPNPATGTGLLAYQWYEKSFGELSDGSNATLGATISGSGTTTLSLTSATINNLEFYVIADYVPSAYSQPPGAVVTVGTARSTGNATNEPATSNTATLTVRPIISVVLNPVNVDIGEGLFADFSAGGSSNDGTPVFYRWQLNDNDVSDSGTVSGSGTPNLRIALPTASNNTVRARISHPTASNSPLFTNRANFKVVLARAIINVEDLGNANIFENFDLVNGPVTRGGNRNPGSNYIVHAPERNIRVRITLQGAAGADRSGFSGGQGGVSVFDYTFERNVEYVFKIGGNPFPRGGLNGGGGTTQLYRKAVLVAGVGGGGGAGSNARGGNGGGIGFAGEFGGGRFGGAGGKFAFPGEFLSGYFPFGSGNQFGGQVSSCMRGDRLISLSGIPACSDFSGPIQARDADNRVISNTAFIIRGYKPGFPNGFRNNGGDGSGGEGGGGSGVYGGNAGYGSGSGGGGGGGYTDGSISLINSQLGGNPRTEGFVTIQLIS
jgi:hypothetical protein